MMIMRTAVAHPLSFLGLRLTKTAIPKPLFPPSSFYTCSSSAQTQTQTHTTIEEASSVLHHPWPEWVTFIDRLKSQGYFPPSNANAGYFEITALKDPCLSFARDRFDLFR